VPTLTVLAGPNGAGKTIFSDFLLENSLLPIKPFNPDMIDAEFPSLISQYLTMESELACKNKVDFAYECNLRKGQLKHINQFAHCGYTINLVYFFLENIQLSEERVKYRVEVENSETSEFELEYCLLAEKGKLLSVHEGFPPNGIADYLPIISSQITHFNAKGLNI
jgi:hypothetical protein